MDQPKDTLRAANKAKRAAFLAARARVSHREQKQKAIAEKPLPFLTPGKKTAAYIPIKEEVDVFAALQAYVAPEYFLVPKVLSSTEMAFFPCTNLKTSEWGIPEPDLPAEQAQVPEILIIPLCGFDGCTRMGYGGGYYDRYLAAHPHTLKIGIAFDEQEGRLEAKPWDIDMDVVITPTRILRPKAAGAKQMPSAEGR